MKDYHFYLWTAYLPTITILLINLIIPLVRYYKLLKKKHRITSLMFKK
ncbi:heme exporter protein CcmD [Rickettsiella grylli]|nr:heme exporter protein CcmD [Rickettsiella grylli]